MFVQWVDRIVRAECVRRINAYSGFNCVEFAAVWPVSGREVLFVQTAARKADGTILVLWWPDETAEARIKPRKGVVRASVGPSGFVIQPLDESVTGPDRQVCLTTCVLQFDMKAWIPASWTDGIATVQHFLLASVIDALAKVRKTILTTNRTTLTRWPQPPLCRIPLVVAAAAVVEVAEM
jgi:hypothetical protein